MPHIRARSVEIEYLKSRSKQLVDRLHAIVACERSWFTLEHIPSTYIFDGEETLANPFIEVLWFPRPEAVRREVARIIAEELRGQAEYATVVFYDLKEESYFENGELV